MPLSFVEINGINCDNMKVILERQTLLNSCANDEILRIMDLYYTIFFSKEEGILNVCCCYTCTFTLFGGEKNNSVIDYDGKISSKNKYIISG